MARKFGGLQYYTIFVDVRWFFGGNGLNLAAPINDDGEDGWDGDEFILVMAIFPGNYFANVDFAFACNKGSPLHEKNGIFKQFNGFYQTLKSHSNRKHTHSLTRKRMRSTNALLCQNFKSSTGNCMQVDAKACI